MQRALIVITLLAAPLLAGVKGKVVDGELPPLKKKGEALVYATYVATSVKADKPAPLILAVHAGRGTARQFVGFLRSLAEAQGAVLIGPRGLRELVGADGYWWKGDRADMEAIDRVLAHAKKKHKIDAKRITAVGLADGAELLIKWAYAGKGKNQLQGLILVNFLWKFSGSLTAANKKMKLVFFASEKAKEKKAFLAKHAEKAERAFARAKRPCVLRIVRGASRSFFHGWEKEFRKAYQWFEGKFDWPRELAAPPGLEIK